MLFCHSPKIESAENIGKHRYELILVSLASTL